MSATMARRRQRAIKKKKAALKPQVQQKTEQKANTGKGNKGK